MLREVVASFMFDRTPTAHYDFKKRKISSITYQREDQLPTITSQYTKRPTPLRRNSKKNNSLP
jgi:hypothetical protein